MPPPAAGPPPRLEQELGARLRRLGDAFQQAHELQVRGGHNFLRGGEADTLWGGAPFGGGKGPPYGGGGTSLCGKGESPLLGGGTSLR